MEINTETTAAYPVVLPTLGVAKHRGGLDRGAVLLGVGQQ
jgi:hypothetical protein